MDADTAEKVGWRGSYAPSFLVVPGGCSLKWSCAGLRYSNVSGSLCVRGLSLSLLRLFGAAGRGGIIGASRTSMTGDEDFGLGSES